MMPVKLPIFSSSPISSIDDRAQCIEQLAGIEAVLAVTADLGDDLVEMVEHHVLLRLRSRLFGRCALRTALPTAS